MNNKTLTVFTPAFNRAHTIRRTFESLSRQTCQDFCWLIIDDGSTDDTRQWVESLGTQFKREGMAYDWMGRPCSKQTSNHFIIQVPFPNRAESSLFIEYVFKPNGGLYTGYNVAFNCIDTELCVCIDSDDFMPEDAVETVLKQWSTYSIDEKSKLAGLVGLDYNVVDQKPIGGFFPERFVGIAFSADLNHVGDVKYVFRTELMKAVAPQIGFEGEKDFNPHYMQMQVLDKYPIGVLNKNLCWVEYQIGADSMSQAIFKQYVRSARSFAKYRLMQMQIQRGKSFAKRFIICAHYVSACLFCKNKHWLSESPQKTLTLLAVPLGVCIHFLVRYKARK